MRRLIPSILAVLILGILVVTGCSPAPGPLSPAASQAAAQTWDLKYSHENVPTEYYTLYGHTPFAEAIEKATGNQVKITLYGAESLVKSKEMWEGVKSRQTDIGWLFTGLYPGQFSYIEVSTLPFLYPNAAVGGKVTWELFAKYPEIRSQFKDVKVLAIWATEPYFIASRSKLYKTLDDFQGQPVRASGGPPADFIQALGGQPVAIGMPEVYNSLKNGAIDAALIPGEAYAGRQIYEVAPYATFVSTVSMVNAVIMNLDLWNSFPQDIQDRIMSVSGESASVQFSGGVFDKSREDMKGMIAKNGGRFQEYTVPADELQRWTDKAGTPVRNAWVQARKADGLTNAQQVLDDALALSKKYSTQ
jgi:TRAP-type transport system periplasmic protein